jgi:PiT family inorganic phosphate transporter
MDALFDHGLSAGAALTLFVCLVIALGFEFVNGFHDTANAVATVIYTNSLKPRAAVMLSGLCNFAGVFIGGIAVALGIMNLLPVELLVAGGAHAGLAMVLALLLSAIVWNLGTWYMGLPASSSHTLIGAILGVGVANSLRPGHTFGAGVNWAKAGEIGLSLIVSPVFGFCMAALVLLLVRRYTRSQGLLIAPPKDLPPSPGVRALLIATCSGVSFAHGSNDGQKGVGLVMLILIGIVPAGFALDLNAGHDRIERSLRATTAIERVVAAHSDAASQAEAARVREQLAEVRCHLEGRGAVRDIPREERFQVRQAMLLADKTLDKMVKSGGLGLTAAEAKELKKLRAELRNLTDYAPTWVLFAIALALGVGTMVGWKRIVVTVGEKIGKAHLTYAQGASAELVAMSTIGFASATGLPVSTTHVLSSGIAGTMVANGSGIQKSTVRNIALAWLLTLPASMTLSAVFFTVFRLVLA